MVKPLGGTFNWYCGSLDTNNQKTTIKNLNVNIKVFGKETGLRCDYTACDGNDTLVGNAVKTSEKPSGLQIFRMYGNDEKPTFTNIFGLDGNVKDFSDKDWELLSKQDNKRIYTENKHFYTVDVNQDVIKVKMYDDRSVEVGEIILDKETAEETQARRDEAKEKAQKEAEEKETKRQEKISELVNNIKGFKILKFEDKENEHNKNKKEEFISILITKEYSLGEIRRLLSLNNGDLIKYNPELKNHTTFWDKIFNRITNIQNFDIIDVEDVTISIPTSSIDCGKYKK